MTSTANKLPPGKRRRWVDGVVKRVDLVDAGACLDQATGEGSHVIFWKRRADTKAAADTTKSPGQPTPMDSRQKWDDFIRQEAQARSQTVTEFLQTDRGQGLWAARIKAPVAAVPTYTQPQPAQKSLGELREAAEAEEQQAAKRAEVVAEVERKIEHAYPTLKYKPDAEARKIRTEAQREILNADRRLYDSYRAPITTKHREAFADALNEAAVEPLAEAIGAEELVDHATAVRKARSVLPIGSALARKIELARTGATVREIEEGQGQLVAMVSKTVSDACRMRQATGEPTSAIVAKMIGDRPGLAAALREGDPAAITRNPWSVSKLRTDRTAYEAYRRAVLNGDDDAA